MALSPRLRSSELVSSRRVRMPAITAAMVTPKRDDKPPKQGPGR